MPVKIICPKHGGFSQTPNNHRRGAGCPICYCDLSVEYFIEKAKKIHANKYDYSIISQKEISHEDIIEIICSKHGSFKQRKRAHWAAQGCPNCKSKNSKQEIEWIKSFNNINIISPYRLLDLGLSVDGYDQTLNIVYEFYGDFWHGNPACFRQEDVHPIILNATFGDLYTKTTKRNELIRLAGYNLITIWELDWNGLKKNIT